MNKLALFVVTGLLCLWVYRTFYFSAGTIDGIYINNNTRPVHEGPDIEVDTLFIYNNLTFKNNTWGEGTYKITNGRISFRYSYEHGDAGFSTTLSRAFLQSAIRISLNDDLGFYYERVESF